MRTRAGTICPTPGCPNETPCAEHAKKPWAGSKRRQRLRKRGSGTAQQQDAARILRQHNGICHVCGQPGANQVDHVKPLAEGGTDTDDNKRPIHARPCHTAKTAAEAARGRTRTRT